MPDQRSELLERARKGDLQAISTILNKNFQSKSITVKVIRKNNYLQILLQSSNPIDKQSTVTYIHNEFIKLKLNFAQRVKLYAKRFDEDIPDWDQEIDLTVSEGLQSCEKIPLASTDQQFRTKIQADSFRISGEQEILYGSLAVAGFITLLLLGISLGIVFLVIAITVFYIKIHQGQLLGSAIKVSEKQLPKINQLAETAATRLCMKRPNVFVFQSPVLNASAMGFLDEKYTVILNSALVAAFDEDEIKFILGHEFSHIKCSHTSYLPLTNSAENMVQIPIISDILGFVFLLWSRKAEYTCDRGGLIACRNLNASIAALAKLAIGGELFEQMNLESLFDQKEEFDSSDISKLSEIFHTHPSIVHRIHELKQFHDSPLYKSLTIDF